MIPFSSNEGWTPITDMPWPKIAEGGLVATDDGTQLFMVTYYRNETAFVYDIETESWSATGNLNVIREL